MSADRLWVWGRHSVLEALRAGSALRVILAEDRRPAPILREIVELARTNGVPVETRPPAQVDRVAPGQNTQGAVAEVVQQRLPDVPALLRHAGSQDSTPFLLALDQIQDPHNLGALLRSANAAGVHGVVLPSRQTAPITGIVAKTSAGAVSHVPVVDVNNLARAIDEVRAAGIWAVGLDGTAKDSLFDVDLAVPVLLAVGSEGSGLRRLTREHCDFVVHIPMRGSIESLNASVAGSIAMFEVLRQRLRVAPIMP